MKKSSYKDLLENAKKQTARDSDGKLDEEDLKANLKKLIVIDPDEEKDRIARTIIDSETKPGSTPPTGQLHLPTMELYDYEPDRLIRDDNGKIIEQDKAPVDSKDAEARRARKHAHESMQWADRKTEEATGHSHWVIEKQREGRKKNLNFGDFIRESNLLLPFEGVDAA
jgi:hypothetical protein